VVSDLMTLNECVQFAGAAIVLGSEGWCEVRGSSD
jgi:hypothetical protein